VPQFTLLFSWVRRFRHFLLKKKYFGIFFLKLITWTFHKNLFYTFKKMLQIEIFF
jgi:hypothetical protein